MVKAGAKTSCAVFFSILILTLTGRAELPALVGKEFSVEKKWELTAFAYDTTLFDAFVWHSWHSHLSISYHFNDFLALQTIGGYSFLTTNTTYAKQIMAKIPELERKIQIPKSYYTKWRLGSFVELAPSYARFALLGSSPLALQIYASLGAGMLSLRSILNESQSSLTWFLGTGPGMRLFFSDKLALRIESIFSLHKNPGSGEGRCPNGLIRKKNGENICEAEWVAEPWLQVGLSLLF